ncbi:unnamed protein product [Amoebophrya sp. A25]|nr:unnamed protein product [Amoebophrya sp. A25]|eukprot:GSA25T00000790001.1
MAALSDEIRAQFAELQALFDDEDVDYAAALAKVAEIEEAFDGEAIPKELCRSRMFCLLKLGKYAEVLAAQGESSATEQAYANYKLGNINPAKKLLDDDSAMEVEDEDDIFPGTLRAQIAFRSGDMAGAKKGFEDILNTGVEDVAINVAASQIALGQHSLALKTLRKGEVISEWVTLYNQGCAEISVGNTNAALGTLAKALKLATKDEDATQDELAMVRGQLGVLYQRMGRDKDAADCYEKAGDKNPAVQGVITNNQIALKASDSTKVNDFLKKLDAVKESVAKSGIQGEVLTLNKALLMVQGKKDQATAAVAEVRDASVKTLLEAAMAYQKKDLQKCEQILKASNAPEAVAALGEFYAVHQKDEAKAVSYYAKLPVEDRIAALDTICAFSWRQKKADEVIKNLREAIESVKSDQKKLQSVLRTGMKWARELRDSTFQAEVAQLYLEQVDKDDAYFAQQLVLPLAAFDASRAVELAEDLVSKKAGERALACDPEELEQNVPLRLMQKTRQAEATTASSDGAVGVEGVQLLKNKRKRKPRYPKGFDPANPGPAPDPERWLPKHQRSTFKNKKKRGNKLARGPQGAGAGAADLEVKKGPTTKNVDIATEEVARKGNKNKKKKK